jgi:hypothetical protein
MGKKILQWLAIGLILEIGLLHFFSAQYEYELIPYLGYLFVLNFLGTLVSAYGLYRGRNWGWVLGFLIAFVSLGGYAWSRIFGLPGLPASGWLFPAGTASVILESLFLLLLIYRPWNSQFTDVKVQPSSLLTGILPIVMIASMVFITAWFSNSAKQITSANLSGELASLEELRHTKPLTSTELEQQYGMRIAQVGTSMLDAIVDVRVKIIDPEKAYAILDFPTALYVNGEGLVLAPYMHEHAEIEPGQIYVIFFPTQNGLIQKGTEVSLVFGNLRVEPVAAK